MGNASELTKLIRDRRARVGFIGMGYVGFPMAMLAADQGFPVTGIDTDSERIAKIRRGESYIQDVSSDLVKGMVDMGRLEGTVDYSALKDVDVVVITVPTPLRKTGDPDMSFVLSAVESLRPHLHSGMLIVLESTTYPGTTKELFEPILRDAGLEIGKDIFVAFSPERIDPGNKEYTAKNTPKVVGGITQQCTDVAGAFYREIVDTVVPVTSCTVAEMVKLYENSFRAINIGLVNELAIVCRLLGVDVWEIIEAAKTKPFGFMGFYPGPGLGGHCIPVDPNYLSWKMRTLKYKTRFIDLATEVNTQMPVWTANRAMELLNEEGIVLKGAKILVLGLAYKSDINDLRESPALDVFSLLKARGGVVSYHDPYCPQAVIDGDTVYSQELTPGVLESQDLVIIATDHSTVDYAMVLRHAKLVFDTRNVTRQISAGAQARVEYL